MELWTSDLNNADFEDNVTEVTRFVTVKKNFSVQVIQSLFMWHLSLKKFVKTYKIFAHLIIIFIVSFINEKIVINIPTDKDVQL